MALVLHKRTTLGGEPGTHLIDVGIYRPGTQKANGGIVHAILFVAIDQEGMGSIVGGCKTGTDTYAVGETFRLTKTGRTDYPFMLCM